MFSFLKKFKKVKRVPSERLVNDGSYVLKEHLFWAEKVQNAKEDGLEFSYKHIDCFFGNATTYVQEPNSHVETFMLKKLTGERQGEFFMPDISGMDFVMEIPNEKGENDLYVIDLYNDYVFGDKKDKYCKLEEITAQVKDENSKRIAKAKTAASKLAEAKQKQ